MLSQIDLNKSERDPQKRVAISLDPKFGLVFFSFGLALVENSDQIIS